MSAPHDDATTLLQARVPVAPVTSVRCALTIVAGPDAGRSFVVEDVSTRRVLIGQSPACDVRLGDRAVSRRHAAIEAGLGGALRIVDLDSSNGTWVNRVRVRDAYVAGGELIDVGGTTLRIDVDGAARPIPASPDIHFGKLMGASPEMRRLYPILSRLAASDVPVLIEGETGTGKEVVAESLHEASARRDGPFVVFDCTTVAASLMDAELFGHERGAFTGATTARRGVFEEAHGGTLFIDEIGDLDLSLQAKLLRALERSEVRRVGSNAFVRVDVRVLAATRRDLDREVQARRFREDLFFRLAVARVELPPLRRRTGDVALLTRFFWMALGGSEATLSPAIIQRFEEYDWPGNVRELHNAVARQLAMGDFDPPGAALRPRDAPRATMPSWPGDFIDKIVGEGKPLPRARQEVVDEFERRYVKRALDAHGGNVAKAAAACGIGRRYFQMIKAKK